MTFVTTNANDTIYTISLGASRDKHGNVDVGATIERFKRIAGHEAVFSIQEHTKNA